MKSILLAAATVVASLSSPAFAQPAGTALDANAPVAPLRHDSAFTDYRRDADPVRADWRDLNRAVDEAARAGGGHAGHGAGTTSPPQPASPSVERHDGANHGAMSHGGMHHEGMKPGGMKPGATPPGGTDHRGMDHGGAK